MAKQVKKWITINGNHVPVYEDGSLGGIGANLQQKKDDEWEDYDEQDKLEAIAERYGGSKPVSGSWDTEVEHEQNAIAEAFNISKEEAKQKMIDELGFEEDQFDDAETKASRVEIYKRQLEDVQDQLDSAPKSKALRDEKAIAELEKKKAELESYIERDEEMPFQSKGLSKEEKAEDWAKETQKDIAAKKANIKEMGYAEAGQFISDHKEEFGLSDDDDAYQIAAQLKNGDIKLDKDGKISKADRDKVSEGLKAMDKAAKDRGDYVEDEPAKGLSYVNPRNVDFGPNRKGTIIDTKEDGAVAIIADHENGKAYRVDSKTGKILGYANEISEIHIGDKVYPGPVYDEATEFAPKKGSKAVGSSKAAKASELARKQLDFNRPGEYAEIAADNWRKTAGVSNERMAEIMSSQDPDYDYEVGTEKTPGSIWTNGAPVTHHYMYRIPKEGSKRASAPEKSIKIGDKQVGVSNKSETRSIAVIKREMNDFARQHPNPTEADRRQMAKLQEELAGARQSFNERASKAKAEGELRASGEITPSQKLKPLPPEVKKRADRFIQEASSTKSIKIGNKEVGVNKGKTPSMEEQIVKDNLSGMSLPILKNMATGASFGMSKKEVANMSADDLRKKLLAIWQKKYK